VGRRGPKPEPAALRILKGETRPSQINYHEPKPLDRFPTPPADLSEKALAVWERVMAEFGHTRIIRAADQDVMRIYCEAVVRYEEASSLLTSSGPLVTSRRSGDLVRNRLHQIARDNAALVRQLAGDLGLSPAARTSLKSDDKAPEDKLARFLA
jgi:P27 family predicted phage terminase small subunit